MIDSEEIEFYTKAAQKEEKSINITREKPSRSPYGISHPFIIYCNLPRSTSKAETALSASLRL